MLAMFLNLGDLVRLTLSDKLNPKLFYLFFQIKSFASA